LFLQSTLPVVNCTFAGNSASGNGGGLYVDIAISPPIANSVFWGNSDAGGMDESAQIHRNNAPNTTVSYSIVQGGWSGNGTNNLDADPLFVDADGADDTIGTQDDDVRLSAGSPAIDSGDYDAYVAAGGPTVDIDGLPRTYDDVSSANVGVGVLAYLDRGAHEYGAEALLENACCINGECVILTQSDCERVGGTYHGDETDCGSVVCDLPIPGDFDGDGDVDMVDYQIFQAAFTGPL
jgi:predicted outer membrane repeat protein